LRLLFDLTGRLRLLWRPHDDYISARRHLDHV
jgi:hypothetical protein